MLYALGILFQTCGLKFYFLPQNPDKEKKACYYNLWVSRFYIFVTFWFIFIEFDAIAANTLSIQANELLLMSDHVC